MPLTFGYDPIAQRTQCLLAVSAFDGFRLYRGDIRDRALLQQMFTDNAPDVVVHLAARAGVRPSLLEPDSYTDINITGTLRIMETMREFGCDRLVFASSSSVYGSRELKVPLEKRIT